MSERRIIEETDESRLSRASFLKRGAGAGLALSTIGTVGAGLLEAGSADAAGLETVTWVSPAGTLDVMNDYSLVVPNKMGYFKQLGLNVKLVPGTGGTSVVTYVAQHLGDIGGPSPAFLTYAVDNHIPVYSIWNWIPSQVFDFAVPANSKIKSPKEFGGKTIALHNVADNEIANPILVGLGVNVKTIKYVTAGDQWPQATAQGQADGALVWEGLRGQLDGEGVKLKYFIGRKFSKQPSNGWAVRKDDLKDPKKVDMYKRFLMGTVMGLEFARANPRAAAQITYNTYPALRSQISPQLALESMCEIGSCYSAENRAGRGWGHHNIAAWQGYLDVVYRLGQTKRHFKTSDILTNELVAEVNRKANVAKARKDAKAYKLDKQFAKTKVPNYPL